jgi:carbon-monoxide dehydrogenase small subunit
MPANTIKLRFVLNTKQVTLQCHPGTRLLDILRHEFGLKGTREGCGHGECGACLVLMNGQAVNSCLVPAFTLPDAEIVTIEGIAELKSFADIRKRLPDSEPFSCDFCSSGVRVALAAAYLNDPEPDEQQIRRALSGNLCACGNHRSITEAALLRSGRRKKHGRKRS